MTPRVVRPPARPRVAIRCLGAVLAAALAPATLAGAPQSTAADAAPATQATRSGRDIYAAFREGLADKACAGDTSARWSAHFANAPRRMAAIDDDVLPLFGYVVDALREAHLPTEYALIPFVESGYRPGARSAAGPAGLWQMIALTARNHGVPIRPGYDGRLSPVDSTKAAVRYLKTLHGMFAGDWRLAVMAYNAGEYRIFGALKRSGQRANAARPEALVGLSGITQAYVRKLHALACVLDQADDREEWLRSLDRQVPVLAALPLSVPGDNLDAWAGRRQLDAGLVRRLNPAFAGGQLGTAGANAAVLAPRAPDSGLPAGGPRSAARDPAGPATGTPAGARTHTVARGESVGTIARRHGLSKERVLQANGLTTRSALQPGMVLMIEGLGATP